MDFLIDDIQLKWQKIIYFTDTLGYNGKSNKVIVLTDQSFFIYRSSHHSIKFASRWNLITHLAINGKSFELSFGSSHFCFRPENPDTFSLHLLDILKHLFTKAELEAIGFDQNDNSVKTPISAITRIKMSNMSAIDKELFFEAIEFSNPTLNISLFRKPSSSICDVISSLPFTNIRSLVFTSFQNVDQFQSAMPLVYETTNLKHIEFYGHSTYYFPLFFSRAKFDSISFRKASLSQSELSIIFEYIKRVHPHILEFHDSILHDSLTLFFSHVFDQLTVLNLDDSPNIDTLSLLRNMKNLQVLSLANCNVEISELLSSPKISSLEALCLSHNHCRRPLKRPAFPEKLILNDVAWCHRCLSSLFLSSRGKLRELSLSRAKCDTSEWRDIFNLMKSSVGLQNLEAFQWDNNPVEPSFFTFLADQKVFTLSLNNVIAKDDYVCRLRMYLQNNLQLRWLSIQHVTKVDLILKSLINHKELRFLDISHSCAHEVTQLARIAEKVGTLVFDGINPNNGKDYLTMLKRLSTLSKEHNISFPSKDLEELLKKGLIEPHEYSTVKDLFRRPPPHPTSEIEHSYFDQPHTIYKYWPKSPIPHYLDDDFVVREVTLPGSVDIDIDDDNISSSESLLELPKRKFTTSQYVGDFESEPSLAFNDDFFPVKTDNLLTPRAMVRPKVHSKKAKKAKAKKKKAVKKTKDDQKVSLLEILDKIPIGRSDLISGTINEMKVLQEPIPNQPNDTPNRTVAKKSTKRTRRVKKHLVKQKEPKKESGQQCVTVIDQSKLVAVQPKKLKRRCLLKKKKCTRARKGKQQMEAKEGAQKLWRFNITIDFSWVEKLVNSIDEQFSIDRLAAIISQ